MELVIYQITEKYKEMQRFKKIAKSIVDNGLDAIEEGISNFKKGENPNYDFLKICLSCKDFKDDPIEFLKVKDKVEPKLTGKMCDDCGCVLSYKLRQNKIICKKWKV